MFVYLVWFSLCFSFFWELRENGVVNNLQFCPLSLGVMLDFLYISLVPVPDPDPQIRLGGGGSVWSKNKGGAGSLGPSSGSTTESRRSSAQEGRATKPRRARIEGASVPIFESFA